jgi:hypothetical protein
MSALAESLSIKLTIGQFSEEAIRVSKEEEVSTLDCCDNKT